MWVWLKTAWNHPSLHRLGALSGADLARLQFGADLSEDNRTQLKHIVGQELGIIEFYDLIECLSDFPLETEKLRKLLRRRFFPRHTQDCQPLSSSVAQAQAYECRLNF